MIAAFRFLRDRARTLVWWMLGTAVLIVSITALYPSVEGNASFEELAEDLPEAVVSAFGMDGTIGLATAPGYLHARLFSTMLPLLLLIFGIGLGTRAIAGDEEDGVLELTLAQPITRRRLVLERYAAIVVLIFSVTVVAVLVLLGSAAVFGALDGVSIAGLVVASGAAGALALLHSTIAFAVGAMTGRRALTLGITVAIAVAGFVLHGLLGVTDDLDPFRFLTPWHWYLGRNMLADGPALDAVVLPIGACALLLAVGVRRFVRRDLR